MHVVVIGLNHETAPIDLRERVRITDADLPAALLDLAQHPEVQECLVLSTCNRTEIYACTPNRRLDDVVIQWLGDYCKLLSDDYRAHLYALSGHKAAEHLFRVAAGIDSLVLGEAQILGQVKYAFATASQEGTTGTVLNTLFQQALTVGKRARSETEIGRGAFSVSSVAVQLAKSIFGDLTGRVVLVVGASKMGELTMTHLAAAGANRIVVTNRTLQRATDLAARFDGTAEEFSELPLMLARADIVLTATSASEPIVTETLVHAAMRARHNRPIFMIDIAVPRDIAPGVGEIDNVFVYNIDDLQSVVCADEACRQIESEKVEAIVTQEVERYIDWFRTLDAVPIITALRTKFESIHEAEFARLHGKLRHLSPDDLETIRLAMRTMLNKISHRPLIRIKDYANSENASGKLDTVCELFGLCIEQDESDAAVTQSKR